MSAEEHSNVTYVVIFGILASLFGLSMYIAAVSPSIFSMGMVFGLAIAKAYLVLAYFMHLEREPKFVKVLMASMVALLFVFFFGLLPDVVLVFGADGEHIGSETSFIEEGEGHGARHEGAGGHH